MAVIARSKFRNDNPEPGLTEWKRLVDGIKNNQPEILAEWTALTANQRRRTFREMFGRDDGDTLRRAGWGVINIGTLTRAAIERFTVKLGKSLYYYHNKKIFEGDIYFIQVDLSKIDDNPESLQDILEFAPGFAIPKRNTMSLMDQFIYRFNHDPEVGVMYAVVQFGAQLVFQILAVSKELARQLDESPSVARRVPPRGVVHCKLKTRSDSGA